MIPWTVMKFPRKSYWDNWKDVVYTTRIQVDILETLQNPRSPQCVLVVDVITHRRHAGGQVGKNGRPSRKDKEKPPRIRSR